MVNNQVWQIFPSTLVGRLQIPSSKSQSIRALVFALLAEGKSRLYNLLPSPDIEAMLLACHYLGAEVLRTDTYVEITGLAGKIQGAEDVIQAGNSGLVLRFIGALSALSFKPIVITGDYSIRHFRPLIPLLDALTQLGVKAESLRGDGGAPILIQGPLHPGAAMLDGQDSQPVSALLIACAFAQGTTELLITQPGEKPWVNLTLEWLARLGVPYTRHNFEYYQLAGNARIEGFEYTVPADFSSLSYPLAAAVLTGSQIQLGNLDFNEPQGDKQVIAFLQQMGACIDVDTEQGTLIVKKCTGLQGVTLDVNDCIDATPLLAVLGCFAEGKTVLTGAAVARKKESDRIHCIAEELRKMGAKIEEHSDGMTIYRSDLYGAELNTHADHRIALSLAVAALAAKGETHIHGADCSEKSFPRFCTTMQKLGAQISSINYLCH